MRELRQECGYTQEELGKKIDQTKSNISKYETGALEPSIETLKMLSNIFNVSLDYLLGKSNIRNPYKEENNENNKDNPNPLLEKIENLSPESIEELEKYMELLKMKEQMDKCKDETSSALENEA